MEEPKLKLVPAKCGCEGCYYEDAETCPGYTVFGDLHKFEACTVDGTGMIFVIDEGENNGERV